MVSEALLEQGELLGENNGGSVNGVRGRDVSVGLDLLLLVTEIAYLDLDVLLERVGLLVADEFDPGVLEDGVSDDVAERVVFVLDGQRALVPLSGVVCVEVPVKVKSKLTSG